MSLENLLRKKMWKNWRWDDLLAVILVMLRFASIVWWFKETLERPSRLYQQLPSSLYRDRDLRHIFVNLVG